MAVAKQITESTTDALGMEAALGTSGLSLAFIAPAAGNGPALMAAGRDEELEDEEGDIFDDDELDESLSVCDL